MTDIGDQRWQNFTSKRNYPSIRVEIMKALEQLYCTRWVIPLLFAFRLILHNAISNSQKKKYTILCRFNKKKHGSNQFFSTFRMHQTKTLIQNTKKPVQFPSKMPEGVIKWARTKLCVEEWVYRACWHPHYWMRWSNFFFIFIFLVPVFSNWILKLSNRFRYEGGCIYSQTLCLS